MPAPMTWADAQRLAAAYVHRHLGDDPPLAIAPWGWEDATAYQVLADTPAALAGDPLAGLVDTPMLVVSKATRQVRQIGWEEALPMRDAMTKVGLEP